MWVPDAANSDVKSGEPHQCSDKEWVPNPTNADMERCVASPTNAGIR